MAGDVQNEIDMFLRLARHVEQSMVIGEDGGNLPQLNELLAQRAGANRLVTIFGRNFRPTRQNGDDIEVGETAEYTDAYIGKLVGFYALRLAISDDDTEPQRATIGVLVEDIHDPNYGAWVSINDLESAIDVNSLFARDHGVDRLYEVIATEPLNITALIEACKHLPYDFKSLKCIGALLTSSIPRPSNLLSTVYPDGLLRDDGSYIPNNGTDAYHVMPGAEFVITYHYGPCLGIRMRNGERSTIAVFRSDFGIVAST